MVYETYETAGFVISTRNIGEGNRFFIVLTRDFGLIQCFAQNVRAEASKLRYNLQLFSSVDISLVRGREFWRITGAQNAKHFFTEINEGKEKIQLLKKFFNLLLRLIHGEGGNIYLFETLEEAINVLNSENLSELDLKYIEILTVARMLHSLGYLANTSRYKNFFQDSYFSKTILSGVPLLEKEFLFDINLALKESHL